MTWRSSVSLLQTRRLDFVSEINGRAYSISVALPLVPPPERGYRVMYVLDGYAYFASAAEATRLNSSDGGVIVVGVGYPDTPEFTRSIMGRHGPVPEGIDPLLAAVASLSIARLYDLTLPAGQQALSEFVFDLMKPTPADVGGLDDFLQVIENEIKPRVAALAPVDLADQTLFGHSLGGMAVLHALFTMPQTYRTYIAASPSIWWNEEAVLEGEAAFAAAVIAGRAAPRILITMGEDEDQPTDLMGRSEAEQAKLIAMVKKARMVENGRTLTARLQALCGAVGYEVEDYAVFPRQAHGISPWPALGRAVSFAYPAPK